MSKSSKLATFQQKWEQEYGGNAEKITNAIETILKFARKSIVNDIDQLFQKSCTIPCPHKLILSLYHEILPICPPMAIWTPKRKKALETLWNNLVITGKINTENQGIAFFKNYFHHVAESAFLTGKIPSQQALRPAFRADLEWLVNLDHFAKVQEGNYHHSQQKQQALLESIRESEARIAEIEMSLQ